MEKRGCNIIGEAENGNKAIYQYRTRKPDLVIMDTSMPEMDGITATKEIKRIDPYAKIVMASAMGQQEMVIEAIQSGASDFIIKPFSDDRVLEAVIRVLNNGGYK